MARLLFTMHIANDLGLPSRMVPIARELADRGHTVAVCNPSPAPARLIEEAALVNVPLPPLPKPALPERTAGRFRNVDEFWANRGMLDEAYVRALTAGYVELIRTWEADLVIDSFSPCACLAARVGAGYLCRADPVGAQRAVAAGLGGGVAPGRVGDLGLLRQPALSGHAKVELFPGGQLGSERQMTEQVRDGALDIAYVADGAASGFYPKLQVLAIPYLFASSPVAWEVLRGPFGRTMAEDIRKAAGFRVLNMSENGFRDFTNNRHPIRTPDDLKGLKMRTMESPVFIRMMQSMGAAATPIGTSELIMSLQQNVVDGQENAPSTVNQFGIADVQKFMSLDDHVFSAMLLLVADDSFDKLPPDQRRIMQDAAVVHADTSNAERARSTQMNIEAIRKKGVQVYATSAAEKAQFKQVAQGPVLEYITQQVGVDLVNQLQAATKQAEATLYGP